MRPLPIVIPMLLAASSVSAEPARRLDAPPEGTTLIEGDCCCGSLESSRSGDYEAAIAWADDGVTSPIGGAFAQRFVFEDTVRICTINLDTTQIGGHEEQSCDLYVWSSSGGIPSSVLFRTTVVPAAVAIWPYIGMHYFVADVCVTGEVWVGCWGSWPDADEGWYVAADVGEDQGVAFTYVAPGVTDRPGWQPVSSIWEGLASVGISVDFNAAACAVAPVEESSWGRIKVLYARP